MAQGNLAEALKSYGDGLAVADRLARVPGSGYVRGLTGHPLRLIHLGNP